MNNNSRKKERNKEGRKEEKGKNPRLGLSATEIPVHIRIDGTALLPPSSDANCGENE